MVACAVFIEYNIRITGIHYAPYALLIWGIKHLTKLIASLYEEVFFDSKK